MAITHVASTSAGSTGGTTITTSSIDTTGANLLVVAAGYYSAVPTLSDSNSNAWTGLTIRSSTSDANYKLRLYYCLGGTVGSGHTFTLAATNSYPVVSVSSFSGVKTSSPLDAENGGGTADFSYTLPSLTPSENNCIVLTGITFDSTFSSITGGWTKVSTDSSGGNHVAGGLAYLIQTTAAAAAPQWTAGGFCDFAGGIAAFKSEPASVVSPFPQVITSFSRLKNRANLWPPTPPAIRPAWTP